MTHSVPLDVPRPADSVSPGNGAGQPAFPDVFVARQPIFDRRGQVYGYELLFRTGLDNYCPQDDLDHAAAHVLENAWLTFGLPTLIGSKKAFINFTRSLLVGGYGLSLPPPSAVIELLELIEPDDEVMEACRTLKAGGHLLAVDDYVHRPEMEPLIDLADLVKVNFRDSDPDEQRQHVRRVAGDRPRLLAEQIETWDEYQQAVTLGFDYFQGYFFCKPQVLQQRAITGSRLSYLKLFQAVNQPETSIDELERAISADVALTHRFLRYLGSAAFGWRAQISNVRQGLVLLGSGPTRRWVSLIALTGMGSDKPHELLVSAAVRARSCELLAREVGMGGRASELFLLGALSLIDAMLDQPMDEVLFHLPLSDDLKTALTGGTNALRPVFELVEAHEHGDWSRCLEISQTLGVSEEVVQQFYRDAIVWANLVLTL